MNKSFIKAVLPFCLSCILSLSHGYGQQKLLDRIVAIVGKEPILLSDVTAQAEFYAFNNRIDPSTPGLQQQVLDAMINEKLILASALEDTTVSVRDEDVTNQLDALIAQRVQQVGSEKRLEELYGMPVSKMKREFRDETRKQLLVQTFQQQKFGSVEPSRREIEEFFQQFKDSLPKVPEELELYHIFKIPKIGPAAKAVVKAKTQKILDSLKAGGDFTDFAKRYSEDKATANSGGDLGSWRRGQFVSEFEEAVFSLKDGQLSDVVETSRGFHIIQLLERHGEQVHARQILFKIGLDSSGVDSTKAFLRALKDSIAHGATFADLAKRHSEDKESGPLGGFLGNYPLSQFDQSIQDVVKELKEYEISNPVPVSSGLVSGYQIIFVKHRTAEHVMNLQDDWKRVEQLATAFKRNTEYQKWLKQLRSEIYWDVRL